MFGLHSDDGYREILPGIRIKALNHGPRSIMTEFVMSKGSTLPDHAHPHEQSGYLVSGKMRMTIGGQVRELEPGDSWCVQGDVRHGASILEDSKAVEVFSPLREEYLAYVRREDIES